MIQHLNLTILAIHPPYARSKDAVLYFITYFDPANNRVWIRGQYYPITLKNH